MTSINPVTSATRTAAGFSILELLVAMAVMSACAAAFLSLVVSGQQIARRQPEAADQQQRARTALETLGAELSLAGAGMDRGPRPGPLAGYFSPVVPSADGGVSIWYVGSSGGQAALSDPLATTATYAGIDDSGTCPVGSPACAFTANNTAILFDGVACHDVVRIDAVTPTGLVFRPAVRGCSYGPGTSIAEGQVRTYRVDTSTRQLLRRDEATGSTQPVLDHVASMDIAWLDSGRRVRLTFRFMPAILVQLPDLVVSLESTPPNQRGG
jgi:prepilin-type N-terminal cleavage/methylation domain-containing protein